jgi:Domain of unknown function (DUF4328)
MPGRDRPEQMKPLRGHAVAAMAGVAVGMLANVLVLVADWRGINALKAFQSGDITAQEALAQAEFADNLIWPFLLLSVFGALPFLVWLWRARHNAEHLADVTSQRRARGWVIFGWFVPIVWFWFPYQVVSDIRTASRPGPVVPDTVVNAWWAAFTGSWMIERFTSSVTDIDVQLAVTVLSTLLYLAAGVLVYLIVNQVTAWQETPRDNIR